MLQWNDGGDNLIYSIIIYASIFGTLSNAGNKVPGLRQFNFALTLKSSKTYIQSSY